MLNEWTKPKAINSIIAQYGLRIEKVAGTIRYHTFHESKSSPIKTSSSRSALVKFLNYYMSANLKSADQLNEIIKLANDGVIESFRDMEKHIKELEKRNSELTEFAEKSRQFSDYVIHTDLNNAVRAKAVKHNAASCLARHKQLFGDRENE